MMRKRRLPVVAALAAAAGLAGAASSLPHPQCSPNRLQLAATFYGEAGGQFVQTLTFRNRGQHSCGLAGWPTLVGVASRRVVQRAPSARPYRPVLLHTGGAASFDVYGRSCPTRRRLRVALPGGRGVFRVRVRLPQCPGGFLVAPLVAGTRDRDAWSFVWHG
jgi:Protein of unknown function (DUF4232)